MQMQLSSSWPLETTYSLFLGLTSYTYHNYPKKYTHHNYARNMMIKL